MNKASLNLSSCGEPFWLFGLGARAGLPAKSIYDDAWILALGTVILLLGDPQHHISFI